MSLLRSLHPCLWGGEFPIDPLDVDPYEAEAWRIVGFPVNDRDLPGNQFCHGCGKRGGLGVMVRVRDVGDYLVSVPEAGVRWADIPQRGTPMTARVKGAPPLFP